MPLPESKFSRQLSHSRNVKAEAFKRSDGFWEIDIQLFDVKTKIAKLASGIRNPGDAIHDLWLRIVIDISFNIHDVESSFDAVPYQGYCGQIKLSYKKLIGLNLLKNFRRNVRERLSGLDGCTHLTELSGFLPTVAVQAFAGEVLPTQGTVKDFKEEKIPFQLDKCHALNRSGNAVKKYYPKWFIKTK